MKTPLSRAAAFLRKTLSTTLALLLTFSPLSAAVLSAGPLISASTPRAGVAPIAAPTGVQGVVLNAMPAAAAPAVALSPDQAAAPLVAAPLEAAPVARRGSVTLDYYGIRVPDPYQWLENDTEETRSFVSAQNTRAHAILDALPERGTIVERLNSLFDYESRSIPIQHGGYWIYTRNSGLQNHSVIYKSKSLRGEGEVVLNPNELWPDGTVSLWATATARDGRHMAYQTSRDGSDRGEWRIRDVRTGQDLTETISDTSSGDRVTWSQDGSGFFYARYWNASGVYFHSLGGNVPVVVEN